MRRTHQDNVTYLRQRLMEAGLPVIHCPSHIIPIHVSCAVTSNPSCFNCIRSRDITNNVTAFVLTFQVGDPQLAKQLAQDLIDDHKIYVQAINFPTVPKGQEMLRVAPTPHHTKDMMNHFVNACLSVWIKNGE